MKKLDRSFPTITFQPDKEVVELLALILKDKPKGEQTRIINECLLRHGAQVARDLNEIDEVAHRILLKARLKSSRLTPRTVNASNHTNKRQ